MPNTTPKLATIVLIISAFVFSSNSTAQESKTHLDLSVTAGSTGLGFELAMPIGEYLGVRAGGTFMPKVVVPLTFAVQLGEGNQMTADGEETRFQRMAHMLEGFVGQKVDDKIEMEASPTMNQGKLLLDVHPFRNKNWHFTTGFYVGKSKIAQCVNKSNEISTLFAVNLYNRLYDNNGVITTLGNMSVSLPPEFLHLLYDFGRAGFPVGEYVEDIVYPEDVFEYDEDYDEYYILHEKGEIIHPKGSTYLMAPSNENSVSANAFVNKFRPYFGFGYSGALDRNSRWQIGFDAGVMFWGGAPKLVDHTGIDLMYDVQNIQGQVGDYVELARHAQAYPVLELKLTHRLW